jgi:hypothetical protein
VKHRIMAGNSARLLVAALLSLSACAQLAEPIISTGFEEDEQIKQLEGETCAKLKELRIGMTASQVLSACERRPLRTSDIITREEKNSRMVLWDQLPSFSGRQANPCLRPLNIRCHKSRAVTASRQIH